MPRVARIDIPGLYQHVIVRGVNRCDIFYDDDDRHRFLDSLSRLLQQTDTDCFAWTLMSNHVHLLLRPRNTRLSSLMRRLLTGYALYFNRRHNRSGHLFQNRYKSIVCDEDVYLLELIRYIHLNPLRVGLVADIADLDNYPWTGHAAIMGNDKRERQIIDEVLMYFSENQTRAVELYQHFVSDGVDQGKRKDLTSSGKRQPDNNDQYDERILGNDDFIQAIKTQQASGANNPPPELAEIISTVCRYYSVDPGLLRQRIKTADVSRVRSVVCYFAVRLFGYNGVTTGAHLGLGRSAVSIAAGRGGKVVKEDSALAYLFNI